MTTATTTVELPVNLRKWVDELRSEFKPPVGNKYLYDGNDFFVMVIGGPNARNDFHVSNSEEYFFQLKGDIVVRIREAGQIKDVPVRTTLVTPVMFLMMIPLMLWLPISQAPNGSIATAFSFIPPAIPFVMILRLAADEPVPWWQIPATILWGYACVFGMVWIAAKIFRVGVLMYGKPPSLLQLLKWLRYS